MNYLYCKKICYTITQLLQLYLIIIILLLIIGRTHQSASITNLQILIQEFILHIVNYKCATIKEKPHLKRNYLCIKITKMNLFLYEHYHFLQFCFLPEKKFFILHNSIVFMFRKLIFSKCEKGFFYSISFFHLLGSS